MRTTGVGGYELLHRGSLALSRVEANGIKVDVKYLDRAIAAAGVRIAALEQKLKEDDFWRKKWRGRFGDNAKLGSLEQLGKLLFEDLGYKCRARTDTGRYKVDEAAVEKIPIPFVKDYIRLRKLIKMKTTYLEGIKRETVGKYLHPNFNLHLARTYRSSSDMPNFQNMPIRNKDTGEVIRRAFVARKGRRIIEIDYSGIEVRVAACYTRDPALIRYITDPTTDMHRDTACDLFMLPPEKIGKKSTRDASKNMFVFPEFYGSVYFQCAPAIWEAMERRKFTVEGSDKLVKEHLAEKGITRLGECVPDHIREHGTEPGTFVHHVKEVESIFWNKRFKHYTKWKKDWYHKYLDRGYFDTLTGFRISGVMKRNEVLNYGIQGSAFHCLLLAIVLAQAEFDRLGLRAMIVGQIHDSMLVDCPDEEVQQVLTILHRVMTEDVPAEFSWVNVPLEVEADVTPVGGSWHDKAAWRLDKHGVWGPAA